MALATPATYTCQQCGATYESRATRTKHCPDCRHSYRLAQARVYDRARRHGLAVALVAAAGGGSSMERRLATERLVAAHPKSVLAALVENGNDEDFEPDEDVEPVAAAPGTPEKIEALAERVLNGKGLWCEEDGA